jgi:TusE/DsrC/DsvC family sulfur relay protein
MLALSLAFKLRLYRTSMITDLKTEPGTFIEFQGEWIEFDEHGYLHDIDLWSEKLAVYLSEQDDITLTEDHWEVVRFVRRYFLRYLIPPMAGVIVKGLNRNSESRKYNIKYLYRLFQETPVRLACKYAGIPKPSGCP